jgi:hypothetical protein
VARTRDPNGVIDQFKSLVDRSRDIWQRTQQALVNADSDLRKSSSLDAFVRVAVAWEVFRSDWHVAAINRDITTYRSSVAARFQQSVKAGKFSQLEPFVQLGFPAHLSVAVVRQLVDPLERNISFGDNWVDRARSDLAATYAAKVAALLPADLLLVAASEKLRNAIAHRSANAVNEMNSALVVLDPTTDADLVRTTRVSAQGISAYLHALPTNERRVEALHRRLAAIAEKLRT